MGDFTAKQVPHTEISWHPSRQHRVSIPAEAPKRRTETFNMQSTGSWHNNSLTWITVQYILCSAHLCSSSACTVAMSMPVCTSVTAKHESSPTLKICLLSEHTHSFMKWPPPRQATHICSHINTLTRTEGHLMNLPRMAGQLIQRHRAGKIPDGEGSFFSTRRQKCASWAEI